MTSRERFEKHNDEHLKFDRVNNKRSQRADLHAFLLLDELFPDDSGIVGRAKYNEIWLDPTPSQVEMLSDAQILELVRCGVRYNDDNKALCMFVSRS